MRELRQDEIDLIERFRKRNPHGAKGPPLGKREGHLNMSVNREIKIPEEVRSIGVPCVPVEELPQEDTISQIKRMVDHLPTSEHCEHYDHGCLQMHNIVISTWAREYLKQMIRGEERGKP